MFMTDHTINIPQFGWHRDFDKMFEGFEDIFDNNAFKLDVDLKKQIKVNVVDNKKEYVVEALLPGLDKEKMSIEINNNKITLTYKDSEKTTDKKYIRKEFKSEKFTRTVILPNDVDLEKASADYKNGVLVLTAPKTNKKKRIVEIK